MEDTLPETNIAPKIRPSQKETSIPTIHFQVRTVSFREGIPSLKRIVIHFKRLAEFLHRFCILKNLKPSSPRKGKRATTDEPQMDLVKLARDLTTGPDFSPKLRGF